MANYYNGVLLPEIPEDVLSSYPYLLVFRGASSASLWAAKSKPYFKVDGTISKIIIPDCEHCRYNWVNDGWTFKFSDTTMRWFDMASSVLAWSNYNVPNGSATATAIYFYSTYPIPEADECYYNGVRLPAIPVDAIGEAPYYWIATHQDGSIKCRCFGEPSYLNSKGELVPKASSVYYQFSYKVSENRWRADAKQDSANWGQLLSADGWSLSWSNHDIRNGSATSTTIYFYGNSPVAVEPETPSGRTSAYLIRSGSTLYTVADGALSALTETEVTASLFQTYGVDEIPDGALLVTLTDPEVLYWVETTEHEIKPLVAVEQAVPPVQTVESPDYKMNHSSIVGIEKVLVNASDDVRFAISFDAGQTWYTHTGQAWGMLSEGDTGMSPSVLSAIPTEDWNAEATTGKFRFRVTLSTVDDYVNSLIVDYLN